jgi:hypothetical protein
VSFYTAGSCKKDTKNNAPSFFHFEMALSFFLILKLTICIYRSKGVVLTGTTDLAKETHASPRREESFYTFSCSSID